MLEKSIYTQKAAETDSTAKRTAPELLCPAGSPAAFDAAIDAGADAIYPGETGISGLHSRPTW